MKHRILSSSLLIGSLLAATMMTSCGVLEFVTEQYKWHYINDSSHEVSVWVKEYGKEKEYFNLEPGENKIISTSDGYLNWSYEPQSDVYYHEHDETWYDPNFNMPRNDRY